MNVYVFFTFALGLILLAEVKGYFYLEIGAGSRLEQENSERASKTEPQPELKPGLYICRNVPEDDRNEKVAIVCEESMYWDKFRAYLRYNFFITSNSALSKGTRLILNNVDVGETPEVMIVGFDPRQIDSPRLETHTYCRQTSSDVVGTLIFENLLPDQNGAVNSLTEYFCCNDVLMCILNDPARARERFLPSVRQVLSGCVKQYKTNIKPKLKKKPDGNLFTPMRTPNKKASAAVPGMNQLQTVMEVMLNKMIDPCILLPGTNDDEANDVNFTCKVYCQFLNQATEIYGRTIAIACSFLIDGRCSHGACLCVQNLGFTTKTVKMLYCNNKYRRSSTTISQCL